MAPEDSLIPHSESNSSQRCTAHCKSTGKQCRQPALLPTTNCRFHGGASPRGIAHPRFRNGAHSRYLPKHLKADYNRAIQDPDLLSLRNQIAILTSREMELTKKLAQLETPPWGSTVDALDDYVIALRNKDKSKATKALAKLQDTVRKGADPAENYEAAWLELREVLQEKTKIVTSENKRLESIGGFVRTEELMVVLYGILEAVREHVEDMPTRDKIQRKFNELIEARSTLPAVPISIVEAQNGK